MGERIFLVVNPRAGGGAAGRGFSQLAGELEPVLGRFEHALTLGPGDATRLAREAIDAGADTVVAFGGDGTLNEVLNGFFEGDRPRRDGVALGHICAGRGGDFRRTIGLDRDPISSARRLRHARPRMTDVGRCRFHAPDGAGRTRYFMNIASFGIGGVFDAYSQRPSVFTGGRSSFGLAIVRALAIYRNAAVSVKVDGEEAFRGRVLNVAVANGQFYAGGQQVAPHARIDDGLLEVVVLGDFNLWDVARTFGPIHRGAHLGYHKVRSFRGRTIEATSDEEVLLDVDGEQPGGLPASFEVVPAAVPLRA